MPAYPIIDRLLRSCAWAELDEKTGEPIRQASLAQRNWQNTVDESESHGLSPYLYRSIGDTGTQVPDGIETTLKALTLLHDKSSRIRTEALLEIVEETDKRDIGVLALKGARSDGRVFVRGNGVGG